MEALPCSASYSRAAGAGTLGPGAPLVPSWALAFVARSGLFGLSSAIGSVEAVSSPSFSSTSAALGALGPFGPFSPGGTLDAGVAGLRLCGVA